MEPEKPPKKKAKLLYKVPQKMGEAIDLLDRVRDGRRALDAKAAAEKAQEELVLNIILERFNKSELEGARGKRAQASIKRSDVPNVKDWKRFEKYCIANEALDLFQRRLNVEACRERWKAGESIAGVEVFTKVGLTLTKVKR